MRTVKAGRIAERTCKAVSATSRQPLRTGVDSLAPSEWRIAAMAANGQSNREIAKSLFLSLKTVEMHLSASYRKLEVHSRLELAEALARHERLPAWTVQLQ